MGRERFQRGARCEKTAGGQGADLASRVVRQQPCDGGGSSSFLMFAEAVRPDVLVVPEEGRHLGWGRGVGTGCAAGREVHGAQPHEHRLGRRGEAVPVVGGADIPVAEAHVAAVPVGVGYEVGWASVPEDARRSTGEVVEPAKRWGRSR